jgi:hypothetical protein
MGNLGDSLQKHAKRLGISRQVEAVGVVEAATKEIEKYVDSDQFEVISFKDGVLKIGVDSASAKNEIQLKFSQKFKKEWDIKRLVFSNLPSEKSFMG